VKVRLELGDGTLVDQRILPVDIVAWERHYERGFGSLFDNDGNALPDARMEHSLWLAWTAQKRCGKTQLGFDEWLASGIDMPEPEDDQEVKTPLAESSSSPQT
jgi:hypothetical protein